MGDREVGHESCCIFVNPMGIFIVINRIGTITFPIKTTRGKCLNGQLVLNAYPKSITYMKIFHTANILPHEHLFQTCKKLCEHLKMTKYKFPKY